MRFAIFVDGPNMLGSLEKLNLSVDNYQNFFLHIIEKAAEVWKECFIGKSDFPVQLWRVFWYQVGNMDELNLNDSKLEDNLKNIFGASDDLKRIYMALAGKETREKSQPELYEKAWKLCLDEAREWYKGKKSNIEGMKRFNHALRGKTNFVEIIESGHWKVDVLRKQVSEKGVDTSLAVDLVTLVDSYDVAVVLSGDADMIPSLNYAKNRGKHVAVVDLIKGYPPEKKGRQSSTRLKSASDFVVPIFVVPIYEMDLVAKELAKPYSGSK